METLPTYLVKTEDEDIFDSSFDEMDIGWLPKFWLHGGRWLPYRSKHEGIFTDEMIECLSWLRGTPKVFATFDMTDNPKALNHDIRMLGFTHIDLNYNWKEGN